MASGATPVCDARSRRSGRAHVEAIALRVEAITSSNKKLLVRRASLLGTRTLLGAPGIATRSILTTSNKKLLGWRPSLVGSDHAHLSNARIVPTDMASAPTADPRMVARHFWLNIRLSL